ncbi:hypothetical protein DY000_02042210 [Brassica cretica]|uniref:Uncharacterized protein n=2 Tax=Brassica TaxID=3705 RepID=A0ABQ7B8S7_BRACR|nr:hypothetical protein DY000_02042210 [Brassica cretica]
MQLTSPEPMDTPEVNLREAAMAKNLWKPGTYRLCFALVCSCYYVSSLVQNNQSLETRKEKKRKPTNKL